MPTGTAAELLDDRQQSFLSIRSSPIASTSSIASAASATLRSISPVPHFA